MTDDRTSPARGACPAPPRSRRRRRPGGIRPTAGSGSRSSRRSSSTTAKIVAAERVPKSNKLMRLQVDLGSEQRQIVAGIAAKYAPRSSSAATSSSSRT